MEKGRPKGQSDFIYEDQGTSRVSEQIMDSYNSGVIDQTNGQLDVNDANEGATE